MTGRAVALLAASVLACAAAHAQVRIADTAIAIGANGSITQPNDEATASFFVLEQDPDRATAASRVNLKMKQAIEVLRREDPEAQLKTRGYTTQPVYPEDEVKAGKPKRVVSWRAVQYVEVKTTNLARLPRLVAAAQKSMALGWLTFGLSPAARRKADQQLIDDAYQRLNERIAAVAKTLGRNPSDAVAELIDFEGGAAGMYVGAAAAQRAGTSGEPAAVEEPSFEPGESTLTMRITGRIKFK